MSDLTYAGAFKDACAQACGGVVCDGGNCRTASDESRSGDETTLTAT